jgi:hypothetical protein
MVDGDGEVTLTLAAFLHLPNLEESPAWEFVAGEMQQKPLPTIHHSILQKRLVGAIVGFRCCVGFHSLTIHAVEAAETCDTIGTLE